MSVTTGKCTFSRHVVGIVLLLIQLKKIYAFHSRVKNGERGRQGNESDDSKGEETKTPWVKGQLAALRHI